MNNYYYLVLKMMDKEKLEEAESILINRFGCTGIEEFNIDEQRVDEILGSRSYSGGDLPLEVLEEVENVLAYNNEVVKKIYFTDEKLVNESKLFLEKEYSLKNLTITKLEQQDWNAEWKKSYSPILVSEKLEIIPEWEGSYVSSAENSVYIYPGMGFGTGSHETTYLCLKILVDNLRLKSIKSCLDYGCGSGILAIALNIMQKQDTTDYYDIDQEALDNCVQNITLNKIEHNHRLMLVDQVKELHQEYDIVFANILQDVLLANAKEIVNKAKKYLIVSGLLNGQEQEVIRRYKEIDNTLVMSCLERKGDWLAILFERAK